MLHYSGNQCKQIVAEASESPFLLHFIRLIARNPHMRARIFSISSAIFLPSSYPCPVSPRKNRAYPRSVFAAASRNGPTACGRTRFEGIRKPPFVSFFLSLPVHDLRLMSGWSRSSAMRISSKSKYMRRVDRDTGSPFLPPVYRNSCSSDENSG